MAYIGNPPANRFVAPKAATQFSGDGSTTAFTLDHAVGSDEDILVSVDGVIQEPSVAYAVSNGTTLTFTAAPSSNSGNNIFVYYLFRTVGTVSHPSNNALSATSGTFSAGVSATTGTFTGAFTSLGIDDNADATAITIDSSENVGIGETAPLGKLHIRSSDASITSVNANADDLIIENNGNCGMSICSSTSGEGNINFIDSGDTNIGRIQYDHSDNNMIFRVNDAERVRMASSGDFFVGKSNTSSSVGGVVLRDGQSHLTRGGGQVCLFNRQGGDGTIVGFASADSTEGTVSISGSTTSYNAFSASHWSRLTDNSKPTILKGTVIETIDEMCDWYQVTFTVPETNDTPEHNPKISVSLKDGQKVGDKITYNYDGVDYKATIIQEADNKHTKCKISDTADSKRVYGVFADWDNDDDTVNDMYVTAVGTHVVRVNKDVTVQAGDLLSSNGDGTAKVQDDDIIRSKTIGKVLTNIKQETYDDGSYTVPCALYCG